MNLERLRPTILRVTLHTYEWTSLVAAARWALKEAPEPLPQEARDQLEQVLASYDAEQERLRSTE